MKIREKPELMCPVKNRASLEACKNYADAVYFSVGLSMRANADVLKLSELRLSVKKCHSYNIKAYLALNCVLYNKDLKQAEKIIKKAKESEVDALILWDEAAIQIAKQIKMPFFISTQANVSNWMSAEFYRKLGAKRVVLSREMTLEQIKEIKKLTKIEIETFVHGAMCYSISGRCLLSAGIYGGKSANCGSCAQPCRKEWFLTDAEGNKIINKGKHFLSAKDLCMIGFMPQLIEAGIDSFKIEGRKRDPRYVETVSRCYREAIDSYYDGTYNKEKIEGWIKELSKVYNRGFFTGFYFGNPGKEGISYEKPDNLSPIKKLLLGEVVKYYPKIKVAIVNFNHHGIKQGQKIVFEGEKTYLKQKALSLQSENKSVAKVKKGQEAGIKVAERVREGDRVFMIQ